jgi:CO/xanthine dehydrogenase FAD-binding subunit
MKAPPFAYVRAGSLADVFALWSAAGPDAKLLAGGQSLLATLAFRLSEPSTLIDISRVAELAGISAVGDGIRVGALTTHAELGASDLVRRHAPLLAEAVPLIAHPAVRNRGTIGGSLAYADPAAELPACVVALDATIVARSARASRTRARWRFMSGPPCRSAGGSRSASSAACACAIVSGVADLPASAAIAAGAVTGAAPTPKKTSRGSTSVPPETCALAAMPAMA